MTIGVGVLATSTEGRLKKVIPDTAILIADTMGSFGDVDSHARLHKAFEFPDENFYALAADRVDRGAELVVVLRNFLAEIPKETRTYGDIVRCIARACFMYKGERFTIERLPKLRMPPQVFDPLTIPQHLNATIQEEWDKFRIGCDLLIAAFAFDGKAYLFSMSGEEEQFQNMSFPGFTAIGCGADNAMFWLSRREHNLGMVPQRSAFHAYEAKLMAEASAHVNEHLDVIVATATGHWFSSSHHKKDDPNKNEHPSINISTLKRLAKKYGMRSTEKIGAESKANQVMIITRSASQK